MFVIGGPDGLEPAFFGIYFAHALVWAMTWPHQLVRVMAAEQINRAVTILSGHPHNRD
ncbi:MAG: 23S rRNA (pseudouridine(1915)-N(3))-methyltransferase RlmH [Methylocella sp.]